MNNYKVNLTLEDTFYGDCCKNTLQRDVTVISTRQTIALQCNYLLNVVFVSARYFTVLVQNGQQVIIRNIYTSHPSTLCLPNRCGKHLLTISGTISPCDG